MRHKLWTIIVTTGAIALSSLIMGKEPAQSQTGVQVAEANRWVGQVRSQLIARAQVAAGAGIRQTHDPFIRDIRTNGEQNVTWDLRSGVNYAIVGVCDEDCTDIDLRLFDNNGNLVDSDTKADDTPVVVVTPPRNARYTLRVTMASCSSSTCWYGVGAFGR